MNHGELERSHGPVTGNQVLFYNAMVVRCAPRINRWFNLHADFLFSYDGDGKIFISSFKLAEELRGRGLGNQALSEVTLIADEFSNPLYLLPAVLGENGLSYEDIINLYRKHGFEFQTDATSAYMFRDPK